MGAIALPASQPSTFTLSEDQQAAYDAFVGFVLDPDDHIFVLEGYAGTGKSTLVTKLLEDLPSLLKALQLITQAEQEWEVVLTATTNKACEALEQILGQEIRTTQSFLNLRVVTDFKKNTSKLVAPEGNEVHMNKIIFVDEASFVNHDLLNFIDAFTENCKIVYIGDPAQLLPPKSNNCPIFIGKVTKATLSHVVRQAEGNPITALATAFREAVEGKPWERFNIDGTTIAHIPRLDFEQAVIDEFSRPTWTHTESKVLAYTNRKVEYYNKGIRKHLHGDDEFKPGDFAVCNSFIANRYCNAKTDQIVRISKVVAGSDRGVQGHWVDFDGRNRAFLPRSLEERKQAIKQARANGEYETAQYIQNHWIDLRLPYACTVNKSQGSTYDRVFIDLDDIGTCRNRNTLARLLYVAVSRARHQVILTGDIQ